MRVWCVVSGLRLRTIFRVLVKSWWLLGVTLTILVLVGRCVSVAMIGILLLRPLLAVARPGAAWEKFCGGGMGKKLRRVGENGFSVWISNFSAPHPHARTAIREMQFVC
jgi:hypothetical protein